MRCSHLGGRKETKSALGTSKGHIPVRKIVNFLRIGTVLLLLPLLFILISGRCPVKSQNGGRGRAG